MAVDQIVDIISENSEVQGVHDLHIWTITSGFNALSCHIVVEDTMTIADSTLLLKKIEHDLSHANIHHTTLQLEAASQSHGNLLFCTKRAEVDPHAGHNH